MNTVTLRPVSESRARWLHQELAEWEREGLLDASQAEAITARYTISPTLRRRLTLGRLLLLLGAAFVGVGLIWLVAANLDLFTPLVRFIAVAAVWLTVLAGGELLAGRGSSPAVVGAVRLLAGLAFGATILLATQYLQVPALSPTLLACWSAGVLVHAYAVRAMLPLLLGVGVGAQWYVLELGQSAPSAITVILAAALLAVLGVGLAVLHDGWRPAFARVWRLLGVGTGMVTLFVAAIPALEPGAWQPNPWLIGTGVVSLVAVTAAVALTRGLPRLEPVVAVLVAAAAVVLLVWQAGADPGRVGAEDWLHAIVSVSVYVALAVGVAALGTLRDDPLLVAMAMLALVAFTTFQSFAVFAAIIQGAWLFLVLGLVLLLTGLAFDRARRRLAGSLAAGDGATGPEVTR